MRAVILAAGKGRRMSPLTAEAPKPMLEIAGQPILKRIIDNLLDVRIENIILVTGYKAAILKSYVQKTYPHSRFTFIHNAKYATTNNIYSFHLALESTKDNTETLLIEADLIWKGPLLAKLLDSPYPNVALVDRYRSGMDGTVVTIKNDKIKEIIPPHLQGDHFDFSEKYKTLNIYKFSAEFCQETLRPTLAFYAIKEKNSYYELILGIIIYFGRETIFAEYVDEKCLWMELDDPNDVEQAKYLFANVETKLKILNRLKGSYWQFPILDFAYIRNMYFPKDSIYSDLREQLHALIQNYGSTQQSLNKKLAYFLNSDEKNVQILNGASQIYPILKEYMQKKFPDETVLLPLPTFGEYKQISKNKDYYIDPYLEPSLAESNFLLTEKKIAAARMTVFVNPNNPTGSLIATQLIEKYVTAFPNNLFLIDESFADFSDALSFVGCLHPNVAVIKSLSKSLGIPGLRLGFVWSKNSDFMQYVAAQIPIWNINSIAEYFLKILLKYRIELQNSYTATRKTRHAFHGDLEKLPLVDEAYPGHGNFLLLKLKKGVEAHSLACYLLSRHNIHIKNLTDAFNELPLREQRDYIRVAVRSEKDNTQLVQALRKYSEL